MQLAEMVAAAGQRAGLSVEIAHLDNPRVELEDHYYNAAHSALVDLGLKPNLLTEQVLDGMLATVRANSDRVDERIIQPHIRWAGGDTAAGGL